MLATLERVAQENNATIEELQPMIHLGGPVSGWVSVSDLISDEQKEPREIAEHVVLDDSHKIEGNIDNFEGNFITIQNQNEDVTLKIKTDDGEFVKEGDIVIGSDGMEYQIQALNIENEEVIDYEEITTGSKLNWSIKNISLAEALSAAAVGIVGTYGSYLIPRKEKTEMTSSQIDAMIRTEKEAFIDAKGKFEGESAFTRATEILTHKKVELPQKTSEDVLRNSLITQDITVENITTMQENNEGGKAK